VHEAGDVPRVPAFAQQIASDVLHVFGLQEEVIRGRQRGAHARNERRQIRRGRAVLTKLDRAKWLFVEGHRDHVLASVPDALFPTVAARIT
jgi:hypothetical protein